MSHKNASTNSMKKRAYEAVNSYQQQVDKIITDSQNKKKVINASLDELVQAENEEKLNLILTKIKQNSELYRDKNKKIIDNHEQRTRTAIKLERKAEITETEKQLATMLRNIINGDSDKNVLENLQKELSDLKSSSKGEKKTIYDNYFQSIDLILEEIKNELTQREQSKKDQEKSSPQNKKTTILLVVIVASISILLIVFSLYLVARRRKKLLKRNKK